MKLFRILAVPLLALSIAGCAHNPAAPPPTAAQATAIGLDDFAASAQAAQQTEIALFNQGGLIDKPTHVAIQKAFKQCGGDIQAVANAINTGASSATISARIKAVTADINTDLSNGVLGVKDPATQAKLKALISGLGSTAAQLTATYGGK